MQSFSAMIKLPNIAHWPIIFFREKTIGRSTRMKFWRMRNYQSKVLTILRETVSFVSQSWSFLWRCHFETSKKWFGPMKCMSSTRCGSLSGMSFPLVFVYPGNHIGNTLFLYQFCDFSLLHM